jgi:hypothetical protein
MRRTMIQSLMGLAAAVLFAGVGDTDDQMPPATLAVVGSPLSEISIGDARHCPRQVTPLAKPGSDRIEFSLAAREPASISLTTRRGGAICGGSLYVVPESGIGYAARLTPGYLCAAQLFRIDPHAQTPVQLLQTDNHPELDALVCATAQGSPGTGRLSVGRNARRMNVLVEIASGGSCPKFEQVSPNDSGIELPSGVQQLLRLKFRVVAGTGLRYCDLNVAFTPLAGAAYLVDATEDPSICQVRVMRADAGGTLSIVPLERAPDADCKTTR